MANKSHPLGFCICTHLSPDWNRPTHWTAQEVSYLEQWYGRMPDERLAKHLNRPILGVRLNAKRLGIRKRGIGLTAHAVSEIFGVDPTTVLHWIEKGLLAARRAYFVGPNRTWLIAEDAVERFIVDDGQHFDFNKLPDSYYKDLAAQHRWYSLAEVERLVGESPHKLREALKAGCYRGALRGPHWYVAGQELPRIAVGTDAWRRQHLHILRRERDERLQRRRTKREGVRCYRQAA